MNIAGREFEVREQTAWDLKEFLKGQGLPIFDQFSSIVKADDGIGEDGQVDEEKYATFGQMIDNAYDLGFETLQKIFPQLQEEDRTKLYPSDIENLMEAFLRVNFTGIRACWKNASPMIKQFLGSFIANM